MKFCRKCRGVLTEGEDAWVCDGCGWELQKATGGPAQGDQGNQESTSRQRRSSGRRLESLPTTDSGAVRKEKALEWLRSLDPPSDDELLRSVTAKPKGFTGSTFAGQATFSGATFAGDTRFNGLYLSVAER